MPDSPLAFFLTWVCYGSWLHGDERGSVDAEHNHVGQPRAPLNPVRETVRAGQQKHPEINLDAKARGVVERTIREVCTHRHWTLVEVNVRTNHVHVVIVSNATPEKTLADLKAWCTRRLREADCLGANQPAWAQGGSTVWLWTEKRLGQACIYVRDGQGDELPKE